MNEVRPRDLFRSKAAGYVPPFFLMMGVLGNAIPGCSSENACERFIDLAVECTGHFESNGGALDKCGKRTECQVQCVLALDAVDHGAACASFTGKNPPDTEAALIQCWDDC
jgi:hypothetical protein